MQSRKASLPLQISELKVEQRKDSVRSDLVTFSRTEVGTRRSKELERIIDEEMYRGNNGNGD